MTDSTKEKIASPRALSIAKGLVRTGRAIEVKTRGGYLRLQAPDNTFYWIPFHGGTLLRGGRRESSTELQPGFADAMLRAGKGD
jgi:hypothetical protein